MGSRILHLLVSFAVLYRTALCVTNRDIPYILTELRKLDIAIFNIKKDAENNKQLINNQIKLESKEMATMIISDVVDAKINAGVIHDVINSNFETQIRALKKQLSQLKYTVNTLRSHRATVTNQEMSSVKDKKCSIDNNSNNLDRRMDKCDAGMKNIIMNISNMEAENNRRMKEFDVHIHKYLLFKNKVQTTLQPPTTSPAPTNTDDEYCGQAALPDPNRNVQAAQITGRNSGIAKVVIPWLVHLQYANQGGHICGGILLSRTYVLTTAHCVKGPTAVNMSKYPIRVSFGTNICNSSENVTRSIVRYITHPQYDSNTLQYDFAILEINKPVEFDARYIYPICLPSIPGAWNAIKKDDMEIFAGCGTANSGRVATAVHIGDMVKIVNNRSLCAQHTHVFTDDMFCAELNTDAESGLGDSGGPLFSKLNGRWTLLGVMLHGKTLKNKGFPAYGYYANVSYAVDWLIDTVAVRCGNRRFAENKFYDERMNIARPREFPWTIQIHSADTSSKCSGAIINNRFIITSSFCRFSPWTRIQFIAGQINWLKWKKADTSRVYSPRWAISIFRLDTPLIFNDYIQPACLPAQDESIPWKTTGWLTGWGSIKEPESSRLRYAEMTRKENCESCLSHSTDYDVCYEDRNASINIDVFTGSPVVHQIAHTFTVVSIYRGHCHNEPKLLFYYHVSPSLSWIKKRMGWTNLY